MKIHAFEFSMFGVNTYVVWDPDSLEAAIVDPACVNAAERDTLAAFIADNHLRVAHLINTHLHIDHTFGNDFVASTYGLSVEANSADAFLGEQRDGQARMFHLPMTLGPVTIGRQLRQGDVIILGRQELHVIEVPGHSPGSIALYAPESAFVITGDALFQGSIGRTDLPGGDHSTLVHAITDRLLTLPPQTVVYPGHGPVTTIARELAHNPYL